MTGVAHVNTSCSIAHKTVALPADANELKAVILSGLSYRLTSLVSSRDDEDTPV